jgi:hypothetical protein
MLKDFEGKASPAWGAINIELTIGSKTLPTTFFIINGKGSYNLLLGRDWIHANYCIPSTMHHALSNGWKMLSKWYTQIHRSALQQPILKSRDMMEWSASRAKFGKEIS